MIYVLGVASMNHMASQTWLPLFPGGVLRRNMATHVPAGPCQSAESPRVHLLQQGLELLGSNALEISTTYKLATVGQWGVFWAQCTQCQKTSFPNSFLDWPSIFSVAKAKRICGKSNSTDFGFSRSAFARTVFSTVLMKSRSLNGSAERSTITCAHCINKCCNSYVSHFRCQHELE